MEYGDSVLAIIRQHVTDCDKIQADPQATDDHKKRTAGLKEGIYSVIKTLPSSDARGRPGARVGGAGHGRTGSRGLSEGREGDSKPGCRHWLRGICDRGPAVFSMTLSRPVNWQLLALVLLLVLVQVATNIALAKLTARFVVAALKNVTSNLSPRNHRRLRVRQW